MSLKIYAASSIKSFIKSSDKKQVIKSDLSIEKVTKGIIAIDKKTKGFGVFDSHSNFIKSSTQLRNNKGQFVPNLKNQTDKIKYQDTDVIFLGNVVSHFGHFLLEHMNRAYPYLSNKYKNAKYVFIDNHGFSKTPEFIYELVGFLGIKKENIIILKETAQFKNVFVPHQAFNIPVFSSKEIQDTFNKISENQKSKSKFDKIYVSRSKMGIRKTYGEEKIQKIFEKNGYHIIYPEKLGLVEQISFMKNCKSLAGVGGTALHLALFMPKGGNVIQIKRNKSKKDNSDIQYLINKSMGLDSVFISASTEKHKTKHYTDAPQIIGVTKYMQEFFDEYGFKYTDKDLQIDEKALKEYKIALKEFHKKHGRFGYKIKHTIIKIMACFVLGRERRAKFRSFMNKVL